MNLFSKYKRIFLIIGFLLIIFVLGFLLYRLFLKPSLQIIPPPGQKISTSTTGQLPSAGQGGGVITPIATTTGVITGTTAKPVPDKIAVGGLTTTAQIGQTPIINPTLTGSGSGVQYYNQADGKFYRIDASGKAIALSDQVFYNVSDVVWAPQKNKAIIEYPDGAKILYNFDTKKQVTIPSHWQDFNFSTDGGKIVMKSVGIDTENNWLAVANDDGSGSLPLENIGANADTVIPSWSPNGQTVAMYTKGVDLDRQEVFFIGLNGENFKSTVVEGYGFQPQWSKTGDRLAYSVYSNSTDLKPELWIVDAQGDTIGANRKDLGVATWASKCTFADNTTMYCGVPETLEKGAGLFPEMAQNTRDNLYQINVATGEKKLVAVPDGDFNMSDLVVTNGGSNLYFTDTNTKILHKIELK
jgi:hypothetical protein